MDNTLTGGYNFGDRKQKDVVIVQAIIRKTSFLAALITIGVISLLPREVLPETGVSDKLWHLAAYGALALLAWLAYAEDIVRLRVMIGLVLYGAALEGLQSFTPGRFFSVMDMIANALGVVIVYAGLFLVANKRGMGGSRSRFD